MDFGGACDRDARFGACVLRETTSHPSIYFEEARDEPVHGTRFSQQVQQRPPPQLACFDLQTDPNREYVGWNRRHDVPPCSFRSLGPGPFDRRLGNDRAGKCIFLTYLHFHSHSLSLSLSISSSLFLFCSPSMSCCFLFVKASRSYEMHLFLRISSVELSRLRRTKTFSKDFFEKERNNDRWIAIVNESELFPGIDRSLGDYGDRVIVVEMVACRRRNRTTWLVSG